MPNYTVFGKNHAMKEMLYGKREAHSRFRHFMRAIGMDWGKNSNSQSDRGRNQEPRPSNKYGSLATEKEGNAN